MLRQMYFNERIEAKYLCSDRAAKKRISAVSFATAKLRQQSANSRSAVEQTPTYSRLTPSLVARQHK